MIEKICPICGEIFYAKNNKKITCGKKSCIVALRKQHVTETCLKKYGCACSFQSDEVKEKIKQTNLERYGVEYASQSDKAKEKIKQTNLERYGYTSYTSTPGYKEYMHNKYASMTDDEKQKLIQKQQETCYMLYGVTNPYQAEEIKNKIKQIKLEKYGDEWYNNREKYKCSCLDKYNTDC